MGGGDKRWEGKGGERKRVEGKGKKGGNERKRKKGKEKLAASRRNVGKDHGWIGGVYLCSSTEDQRDATGEASALQSCIWGQRETLSANTIREKRKALAFCFIDGFSSALPSRHLISF